MSARRDRRPPSDPAPVPPSRPAAPAGRAALALVLAMAAAYAVGFQGLCVQKFRFYLYRDFDFAIFVQAIHGVLHGGWFSSIRGMDWLGDHSSLILLPLAPLFAIVPHPLTLLGFQTVALAAGAFPVWALARREGLPGPLPVACAALWLLHPALGYLNLAEFHPEALAAPFLLWCVLEVRAGRTGRAAIAAGIALLAREDVALAVLGLAVAALAWRRPRRMAATLAALAVVSLVLSFAILKPLLASGQAEYGHMYARWGATPAGIVAGLARHPLQAIASFWTTPGNPGDALAKKELWAHLFLPVSGVALFAPLALVPALPIFAEHLLSERVHQHTIVFQYAALTLPFVMAATVLGLGPALRALAPRPAARVRTARAIAIVLLLVAAVTQVLFGPVVGRGILQKEKRPEDIAPDAFERTMKPYRDRMLARVPRDGAVIAGFEFLPHLAMRPAVHSLHHVLSGRYTYSDRAYPRPTDVRAILGDMSSEIPYLRFDSGARLRAIAAENDLRPADAAGGTILMLPDARDSVEFYRVGAVWAHESLDLIVDEQLLFLNAECLDSVVTPGGVARIVAYWKRLAKANRTYLSQTWLASGSHIALYGRARPLGYGILPPQDWPADTVVSETYHLLIPDDFPPGTYRPLFRPVSEDREGHQDIPTVRIGTRRMPMNFITLREITVAPVKR